MREISEKEAAELGIDLTMIKVCRRFRHLAKLDRLDCQHFFRQIFLGYFSDIVQAFDTLRKNVCGDDYTSLHNPIVLSSVLPAPESGYLFHGKNRNWMPALPTCQTGK